MRVIAITGGIGSGKSTVRRMFEELGALGIDADELAREVVQPGSKGARLLRDVFGSEFFKEDGQLDRKRMAEKVFADPDARRQLEQILHPLIRTAERKRIHDILQTDPKAVVVMEIPLLAEAGRSGDYDWVILVTAPEGVRSDRLVQSGRYSPDQAAARMATQTGDRERRKVATWVVDNGGDLESTARQVRKIYRSAVLE